MKRPPAFAVFSSWLLPVTATLAALLACWAVLTVSSAAARTFSLALYLLANLVILVDVLDFALRLYFRRIHSVTSGPGDAGTSVALDIGTYTPYQRQLHIRPYAILVSVYNAEDSIDGFLEAMEPHRERFWIIDDGSTDNTCSRIRQAGWRVLEGVENRKKPGALRRLLAQLPPEIETVLVLDPDVTFSASASSADLDSIIFEFQRSGMAAFCPRISIRRDGLLARLQSLEYCMAFSLGRMSLADSGINSGISVYRRGALAAALQSHSLSVYAEDLENSAILLGSGERIYYDGRLVVQTEGKRSFSSWFSQRVGWAFGLAKVFSEHLPEIRRAARRRLGAAYQFLVYMAGFNLLLHPLKLLSLAVLSLSFANCLDTLLGAGLVPDWKAADPVYFLAAVSKFMFLSLAALFVAVPRGERAYLLPAVPLYPFYILAQIIPTAIGYVDWLCVKACGRRIWGDHYDRHPALFSRRPALVGQAGEAR